MSPPEIPQHTQPPATGERPRKPVRFQDSSLAQSKLAVLAILFFVTGFLGLPLLWICRKFSNAERWFWAIVNTVYTCILIWIVIRICLWSWSQISQAF